MTKKLNLIYIDALRGYAILGVILVHSLMGYDGILLGKYINFGAKGVQLFYTISAFTLFLSYSRRKDELAPIRNFYLRRFFRIAPLFYLAIIYYLIQNYNLIHPVGHYRTITLWSIISHFFLLHGLSPYWMNSVVPGGWSVGVECMFYILCPLLFSILFNIKRTFYFFIVTFILGQLLFSYFSKYPIIDSASTWKLYLYTYLPTQLPVFILGILTFYIVNSTTKVAYTYISFTVLLALTLLFIQNLIGEHFELLNNLYTSIAFIIIIFTLSKYNVYGVSNKFIRFIGKISFSLYLTHFTFMYFIGYFNLTALTNNNTVNYLIRLGVISCGSVPLSYLTYSYIEVPFQRLGKLVIDNYENKYKSTSQSYKG